MKKLFLILAMILITGQLAFAQIRQEIIPIVSGDSVALILTVPPTSTESFHVYRQGPLPGNEEYTHLTTDMPVAPVIDASKVKIVAGDDWRLLTSVFGTEEPFEILRKLRGDDFIGMVHSLLSPNIARLTGRWYLDTGLQKGAVYNYKIVIVNSSGKEKKSLERKVTIADILPQPPTGLETDVSDGKVVLKWNYPKWSGNYDDLAIQFYVHRKRADGEYKRLDHMPIIRDDLNEPLYTDRWLENGIEYTYFVTAVDPLSRQSSHSTEVSVIPVDETPPDMPHGLSAEGIDGAVILSWNMSLELDAGGYNVYRSEGLQKEYQKINESPVNLERPVYYDSTITNGVQYFYTITAIDISNNESERSNAITALGEDKTPPDPPTNLRYSITDRILTLSWSPSKAKDLSGYYVYRGMSEDIQPKIIHEPYLDTIFADKGYQSEGMTAGKSFWVSVSAADRSRNESEKLSMIVEIPDDVPPLPPQGFYAENENGRYIRVSCSASPSLDVALYRVFRDDVQITEFESAPFAYKDSTVTKGRQYTYFCVALDSADNQSPAGNIDTVFVKDDSPPPSPRNISAKKTERGIQLKWERVVDFDLIGYNVYRASIPAGRYIKLNSEILPLDKLEYLDSDGMVEHYYKIKAVDSSGNESTRSKATHAG